MQIQKIQFNIDETTIKGIEELRDYEAELRMELSRVEGFLEKVNQRKSGKIPTHYDAVAGFVQDLLADGKELSVGEFNYELTEILMSITGRKVAVDSVQSITWRDALYTGKIIEQTPNLRGGKPRTIRAYKEKSVKSATPSIEDAAAGKAGVSTHSVAKA